MMLAGDEISIPSKQKLQKLFFVKLATMQEKATI